MDGSVLRVTLVQEASTLDPAANRARLAELTPPAGEREPADLVVWPEAFARDFGEAGSDVSAFAESVTGPFASEVARVADAHGTTVVAGMFERSTDPARPFNTLVVRGAASASYRKIHLYDSFGYRESDALSAGEPGPVVVTVGGWQLGLMTCYDLRFPELARLLVDAGAEVLVVPAAWVAGPRKVDHWRTLLRARAIENTVYVVATGQPGPRYTGHSTIIDPLGDVVVEAGEGPEVVAGLLRRAVLDEARRTNPSLRNRRL
ncbi:carbon-nitrogen hydrolase family protein [Nocardioides marinquilinus]|uniref:Carbon-nitrogen hydrolase family protein n=1 Tax=Nocardioides marinquilinus TaxID=1210400 RepID=A0ABP9PBC4_9ACTN